MKQNIKFHARRDAHFGDGIEIIGVVSRVGDVPGCLLKPTTIVQRTNHDMPVEVEPWITLDRDSAQRLMDELWNVGLRPTEGSGSAGAMAATQKHLEDMRTLVFNK